MHSLRHTEAKGSEIHMTVQTASIWLLKKGSERKFRFGHPWVFSNELAQSPKGLPLGELIELRDYQGSFLARGYGHPNSLIAFRTLTLNGNEVIDAAFFQRRFEQAALLRQIAGLSRFSHRLCFAEGDRLPGLVIDRYILAPEGQVLVIQSSTAGMDRLLPLVYEALQNLITAEHQADATRPSWAQTSLVVANDSKSRAMENIASEPKTTLRNATGFTPELAELVVQPGLDHLPALHFKADFIGGQKTGFFLDQRLNVHLASRLTQGLLQRSSDGSKKREIRVLDLCCYIGQWGSQLAHLANQLGHRATVTCVDSSAKALQLAGTNVEAHGGVAELVKMDVLTALEQIPRKSYDIVICDPPAFIKKKKDLPTGSQAYFKMNREAIRKVASSGIFVSCSCSGLFLDEDFRDMLSKVSSVFDGKISYLARGGHSPDHPQRPEFPQGTYLKAWLGVVE